MNKSCPRLQYYKLFLKQTNLFETFYKFEKEFAFSGTSFGIAQKKQKARQFIYKY